MTSLLDDFAKKRYAVNGNMCWVSENLLFPVRLILCHFMIYAHGSLQACSPIRFLLKSYVVPRLLSATAYVLAMHKSQVMTDMIDWTKFELTHSLLFWRRYAEHPHFLGCAMLIKANQLFHTLHVFSLYSSWTLRLQHLLNINDVSVVVTTLT